MWGAANPEKDSQNTLPVLSLSEKSERITGADFGKPHKLAYWPIIPETEKVWVDGALKSRYIDYTIDYSLGQISMKAEISPESTIRIDYQIIPISVQRTYQRQLFAPAETPSAEEVEAKPGAVAKISPSAEPPSTLNFSGTKSLSLSMESLKGLTINQPTRLNVSGKVSETVSVTAMLSDQDLPLQPEGTTEELEDLDRILIRIEGEHLAATLGDYEAAFGDTEFVLSQKMLEGAQAQGEFDVGGFTLLGAVSKGQNSSITLAGVEGQNEYRISVEGRYIVMIAGSESVWLNGEKMVRGEKNDYAIREYGDPIVEFTNKHLITSSDVIVVDFEYIDEDRNYRQDLYGTRGKVNVWRRANTRFSPAMDQGKSRSRFGSGMLLGDGSQKGLTLGVSYATESDDKDNPLIPLNDGDIASLKLNDLDPDGDGALLPAPMERSVMGFDGRLGLSENTDFRGEIALSKRDLNTFSEFDEPEEGMAWKLKGSSGFDRFGIDFDLRQLDPNFVPVGATFSSRARSTYQRNYDSVSFGDVPVSTQTTPTGESSYNVNLWLEPIQYVEIRGDLGRTATGYSSGASFTSAPNETNHWSRSFKINLPNLPQLNTRYQEAVTKVDGEDSLRKTREQWQLEHELWEKLSIGAQSEDIESVSYDTELYESTSSRDRRSEERRFTIDVPTYKKMSISGEYSFETNYVNPMSESWLKSSSAQTISANLSAKPKSWLDFSGYFARRKFDKFLESDETIPDDSTTNLADMKLNLKSLRISYQIDRKLSPEREEQYVNYVLTEAGGEEEIRYLQPGEGNYVKIDEYTYREDMEKGDYIRLWRTVRDRPVTSLAFQSVLSLRPRSSFRTKPPAEDISILNKLRKSINRMELGVRVGEEQESASKSFYLLQDLLTDKTIYGLRRYWYRSQISPIKRIVMDANWETGKTLNKRINSRTREFKSDRWNVKLESPVAAKFSLGGEWEQDNSTETVLGIQDATSPTESENGVISDISERQKARSLFVSYHPAKTLSRVKVSGTYETEIDEDILSDDPAVSTSKISLGSEATLSFRGRGTVTVKYEIARGNSSGALPFARYDFHEGISHKIRTETSYRLKWFTDIMARLIYRAEISEDEKPDHRLEMEMTANF